MYKTFCYTQNTHQLRAPIESKQDRKPHFFFPNIDSTDAYLSFSPQKYIGPRMISCIQSHLNYVAIYVLSTQYILNQANPGQIYLRHPPLTVSNK